MFIFFPGQIFKLQRETVKVNVTKRCSGDLSTGLARTFMRGGRKSDIMDFLFYHDLQ